MDIRVILGVRLGLYIGDDEEGYIYNNIGIIL